MPSRLPRINLTSLRPSAAGRGPAPTPLAALGQVLQALDALRNGPALMLLLATFAAAGLLLAMAEASLAREALRWGQIEAGAALTVAFYGSNAAGLLLMDEARPAAARRTRPLRDALFGAHRLLVAFAVLLAGYALLAGAIVGLFWLSRSAVFGPVLGPLLFGLLVPLGVIAIGLMLLSMLFVVVPLAAPAVWSGATIAEVVRTLLRLIGSRLLIVALLMAAVALLAAAVGALASFVVMAGGRAVAALGIAVVGVELPAQQLMAGLFGYGLRSLGAVGAPVTASTHGAAALVGGGVVFALALVLPGLVYLRGACAVYLAMTEASVAAAENRAWKSTSR
jgi:hypothetical protein